MHTFVTSVVLAWWHGEFDWARRKMNPYPSSGRFQTGRLVLISNMIHQDFENNEVILKLSSLTEEPTRRRENYSVPSFQERQSDTVRAEYDDALRCWMAHYLTVDRGLPSIREACSSEHNPMTLSDAVSFLQDLVKSSSSDILRAVKGQFFWLNEPTKYSTGLPLLSLEVLVTTAYHQFRNEINMLEKICEHQGYIYTFDPPNIFCQAIGRRAMMALIYAAGLKHFVQTTKLRRMHAFVVTNMPGSWLQSIRMASRGQSYRVMSKEELYSKQETPYDQYKAPPGAEDAVLVLHNNSDAFVQNIEFEGGCGSLDAIVGEWSSAAASLLRTRDDLLDHLARQPEE